MIHNMRLMAALLTPATCLAQDLVGHWEFASKAETIPNQVGEGSLLEYDGCESTASKAGTALRAAEGRTDLVRPATRVAQPRGSAGHHQLSAVRK